SGSRTLLIATYREDEVGPRHPLRIALGDVASAGVVRRITLQPLSAEAVARLARGSGLDPLELHRRTGGNPFFTTEVLATPSGAVPITVRDAIVARISRLSAAARGALEAAAVAGARAEVWLIEAIAADVPESLEACVEAGLLWTDRGHVLFRHEL